MSGFKTAKGTDLPILNLRGKDYLEVKYRIVWFREEHPDWSIETEAVSITEKSACFKAWIKDQSGRIVAMSHKFENVHGFQDFIEKAETGSIGRALALCGYGTQFCADELDEGNRLADSPAERPKTSKPVKQATPAAKPETVKAPDKICKECGAVLLRGQKKWYCPNYKKPGEHSLVEFSFDETAMSPVIGDGDKAL